MAQLLGTIHRPPPRRGPHGIRHNPISGPVAAADHVAGAGGGDGHAGQGVGQLLPNQSRQHHRVGEQGIAVEAG